MKTKQIAIKEELFEVTIKPQELQDLLALQWEYPLVQVSQETSKAYKFECHTPQADKILNEYLQRVLSQDTCTAILRRAFKGYTMSYLEKVLENIEITLRTE